MKTQLLTIALYIAGAVFGIIVYDNVQEWAEGGGKVNQYNEKYSELWELTEKNVVARSILINRLIPIEKRIELTEKELKR